MASPDQKPGSPRGALRSTILFLGGLGIIIYEVRWSATDRPWLYGVALVMMGLISPEVILAALAAFGFRRGNDR